MSSRPRRNQKLLEEMALNTKIISNEPKKIEQFNTMSKGLYLQLLLFINCLIKIVNCL